MIVAGFGLRGAATLASLRALLGETQIDALAVVADKASHPALIGLAAIMAKPLLPIALADLAVERAQTPAPHQPHRYGNTSVAEAAALAAAGPMAVLIHPRIIAADGTATMALAQGPET
ncbi:cobalamin biosynthesis protein [Pseudorhodobacter ferrugineus]|uniref:cobalamin biosynthesis protein n=1 Tax=Pseudorhodobacter ferrugineus TaxID=77008 RepID=UPI0003B569F8|nr:cobalamin biosynthesis protein [Pseudorhodobacter ferrugineus]